MSSPRRARSAPLDRVDRLVVEHLRGDGRATIAEIAAAVSVSPSSAQRRLRRLEDDGVIRGYRAVLDREAVGEGLVVHLTVSLADHSARTVDRFEQRIVDLDGLVACHHVTGDVDYLLRLHVADLAALDTLLRRTLVDVPGIARFTTMVTTSTLRDPL